MRRAIDKRAVFFLIAAAACAVLVPLTPAEYRGVGVALAVVYAVLALVSWLDFRGSG
jgi:hypothetical protein